MPFQSNPTSHHPIVKNKENQGEREAEALNNQEQPEHPTGTLTRARPDSGKLTRKEILRLQTTIGNRAVSRILARKIQRRAIQRHQNAAPAPAQPNGPLIEKGFETETEGGEVNRLTTPNGGAADPSENKTRMPIDDGRVQHNSDRPAQGTESHLGPDRGTGSKASLQPTASLKPNPVVNSAIQRTYAALSDMSKARVDQQADEKYTAKTQEFEFKMSPIIMEDARTNKYVDVLVGRTKRIVTAWAEATGRELGASFEREFGWPPGDEYYGAFEMTAENITKVFEDKSQPMRAKLKLVYNAVRNNNMAKWLKVAALELDQKAKGQVPKDMKIKTATTNVTKNNKIVKGIAQKETVKTGFAENSGLSSWLTKGKISELSKTAQKEKLTEESRSKRDVFGHDRFSGTMGWKAETTKANKERRGGASGGLDLSEQRTVSTTDVTDLTDAEIDQMYKNQGKPKPTQEERDRFRTDPTSKIRWGQGGEYYDVQLGSDSAKQAAEVKARMEAGISGSTDLMMHAMENLGMDASPALMKGIRLALAGWMMANRDHSLYEIYKAAESYGVPFEIDKNDIGKEYESASNLFPMQKDDFKDVLPEQVFPKYFQSTAYKDILSGTLTEGAKDEDNFKGELLAQGVPQTTLDELDKRDTAALSRLAELVKKQNITSGDRYALKKQALRRLKQTEPFIHLGNKFGEDKAGAILNALLSTHHGGKGMVQDKNDAVKTLADAGIPRVFMTGMTPLEIKKLELVRQAVLNAPVDKITKKLVTKDVTKALNAITKLNDNKRQVVKAVLIKTYFGDAMLTENELYQANAANMLAGHEESGVKKLTTAQLDAMQAPTTSDGKKIADKDYWASADAKGKLASNLTQVANTYLRDANKNPGEKLRIKNVIKAQLFANDDTNFREGFEDIEREEGFIVAVTSVADAGFIENNILPKSAKESLEGLRNLHDKELGAIFQYTTNLYKPLVNATNSLGTGDFTEADTKKIEWGSPMQSLKYSGPMLQAISSGLAKLPVYGSKVYRLDTVNDVMTQSLKKRQEYCAQNYRVGSILTQSYPMSTAKSLNAQFAKTNYTNPTFSVVMEIDEIKSGKDIQFVSDKVNEEEVLFAPGSRLQITAVFPHNPDDDKDTHIWVRAKEV